MRWTACGPSPALKGKSSPTTLFGPGWLDALYLSMVGGRFGQNKVAVFRYVPCCFQPPPTTMDPARGAYFGSRFDLKARYQCNMFERFYQCRFMCDQCMSQNPTPKSNQEMWYFDFRPESPRYLTYISDLTYRRTASALSPWACMPGWSLRSCFYDMLHIVYLGVARDLVGNLLSDFIDCDCLPGNSLEEQLRSFSSVMNKEFKRQKILGR